MQVSGRARLAWANRNLEEAADIIVAEYLRELAKDSEEDNLRWDDEDLMMLAYELDPAGDPDLLAEEEAIDLGCGDSYCHICGDPGDLFDDLEEDDGE